MENSDNNSANNKNISLDGKTEEGRDVNFVLTKSFNKV